MNNVEIYTEILKNKLKYFEGEVPMHNIPTWIAALESGKYPQTEKVLVSFETDQELNITNTSYCCLGVYGVVCENINYNTTNIVLEQTTPYPELSRDERNKPGRFNEFFDHFGNYFSVLNDDEGMNFKEIAQVLRNVFL